MNNRCKNYSRTRNGFLNALSSVFNYVVSILINLFLNPFLVKSLGADSFGIWKICQRLLVVASAADGKPTQALKWTIASLQQENDVTAKQKQIGCALTVWLYFLPILLVLGSLLSWLAPTIIYDLPPELLTITRITCAILLCNLILSALRTVPEAVMIGMNLAYRTTLVSIFSLIVGANFMVLAVYYRCGLVGLAGAFVFTSLLHGMMIYTTARLSLPWLKMKRPTKEEVRTFFGFSIWIFFWAITHKILLSCDLIILGMVVSPSRVATYSISFFAVQTTIHLSGLLTSAAMPGLGDVVSRGDLGKAASLRLEIHTISFVVYGLLGSMILLWNRSFVWLWVGPDYFIGPVANLMLVFLMMQLVLIRIDAQIIDVTLRVKAKVVLGALATVLSFVLALKFSKYLFQDVTGVIAGLFCGRFLLTLCYPLLVRKVLKVENLGPQSGLFRNLTFICMVYCICYLLGNYWVVQSWFGLFTGAFVSLLSLAGLIIYIGLTDWQRRQLQQRLCLLPLPWVGLSD